MKKQLLLLVMMLLPMVASAGDVVEVDGIYYNLIEKSKEAEVTKNPNGNYRISVDIPAYFEYFEEPDYEIAENYTPSLSPIPLRQLECMLSVEAAFPPWTSPTV